MPFQGFTSAAHCASGVSCMSVTPVAACRDSGPKDPEMEEKEIGKEIVDATVKVHSVLGLMEDGIKRMINGLED